MNYLEIINLLVIISIILIEKDKLSIDSEVSFKITKLGVDLYNYFAKSEENYEKGIFKSYSSKTKQNKKDRYVNINLIQ